ISAPAQRRHAPARAHRHGHRGGTAPVNRRRADDGARRQHPGRDFAAVPRDPRRVWMCDHHRHARSRYHTSPLRPGHRDVRRPHRRGRADKRYLPHAAPSVYQGVARLAAAVRGGQGDPASDPGPSAKHGRTAVRLRLRRPLCPGAGSLPARAAGSCGGRGAASRFLLAGLDGYVTSAPEPLVALLDVSKRFVLPRRRLFERPRGFTAVDGVSFAIPPGTTFGVVGESGSGKTTLARMLLKLEHPSEGVLRVAGEDIFAQSPARERAFRRRVQAVFQDPYGALSPRLKAGAIIAEPLRAQGADRRPAGAKAREGAELVGLRPEAAGHYPHQFSGVHRQRIAIARALSVDPQLLVLDEPVSALDVSVRAQVLSLLRDMQQRLGLTYLFIGHDLAVVRYLSDAVGVMYFGRMVETDRKSTRLN